MPPAQAGEHMAEHAEMQAARLKVRAWIGSTKGGDARPPAFSQSMSLLPERVCAHALLSLLPVCACVEERRTRALLHACAFVCLTHTLLHASQASAARVAQRLAFAAHALGLRPR